MDSSVAISANQKQHTQSIVITMQSAISYVGKIITDSETRADLSNDCRWDYL